MEQRARSEPSLRPPARLRTVLGWSALVGAGGGLLGFAYLAALSTCSARVRALPGCTSPS
jgi:hypothetical protein